MFPCDTIEGFMPGCHPLLGQTPQMVLKWPCQLGSQGLARIRGPKPNPAAWSLHPHRWLCSLAHCGAAMWGGSSWSRGLHTTPWKHLL